MGVTGPPRTGAAMSVESAAAGPPPLDQTPAGTPGWNVIVTLPEATAPQARRIHRRWGSVHLTGYFHAFVMAVPDPDRFVHESGEAVAETPGILNFITAPRTREREEDAIGEPQIIDLPLILARAVSARDFQPRVREIVAAQLKRLDCFADDLLDGQFGFDRRLLRTPSPRD